MGYRLGIELGRSRTTAVIVPDGEGPRPIALSEDADDIATALFVERHGAVCAGARAQALAVEAPERLLHSFLDRIGSAEPLRIGDGPEASRHHAQDVAAALIAWVVARVAELEGEPARAIAVSMPTDLAERTTIEPFKRALAAQGMADVRVVGEYIAAGRLYTHAVRPTPGEPFVVLVLGASGVRAAVLRGDDEGKVFPLGAPVTRAGIGSNAYDEAVLRHAMTATEILGDIEGEPIDADAWRATCRAAREELCELGVTEFIVAVGDYDVPVVLDRAQFEADIKKTVSAAANLVGEAVDRADIALEDVGAVLLCGPAAATPSVGRELAARLRSDARLIREPNPALTVAAGAALALLGSVAPADRQTKRLKVIRPEPARAKSQPAPVAASVQQPTPVAAPIQQPTPVAAPIQQPAPIAAPIQQPTPVAAPIQQPAPVAAPIQRPTPVAAPIQQPAPVAAPIQQPTPVAAPIQQPAPIAAPIQQPTPVAAPIQQPTPVTAPVQQPAPVVTPVAQPTSKPVFVRPVRPVAPAPAPVAPAAPVTTGGRIPAQPPSVGTGRPIRSHEPKGAPRRDHARLLGLDNGMAPARGGTTLLAVIPGRELGTVEALLQTPAQHHTDLMRRAGNPAEEAWVDAPAEFSEIEDHIVDERTLGQRIRSMATPARVLTLGVLTVVVVVGTGAWIPIH